MNNWNPCTADGCENRSVGRKLCRKHYQAAWKAGQFVNEPLPPRQPGRTMCPPEHRHDGSSTCYIQHQCRCVPCKAAHALMSQSRSRLKAYGRFDTGLVDAEPVREHMMMLGEFGLGYNRIAALAGIGITPARNVIWGRQQAGPRYGELQKRIKRETAEKLLAVKPDLSLLAPGAYIPSRGTHRRIQALVTLGWSQKRLGERLGIEGGNFWTLMRSDQVTVRRHLEVAALFDEIWNTLPPREEWHDKAAFARSVNYAKARRWLPPLAWDDIDNDVEPPLPDDEVADGIDEMAVELALSGDPVRLTPAERREAVTRLHAAQHSDAAIADRLHCAPRTVLRIRHELGLETMLGADGELIAS